MKNKARLAFEMLEKEMEVMKGTEMERVQGGREYAYKTNPYTAK